MKLAIILAAVATVALTIPANAQDAHVGVGVGPISGGVSVGDHDRYREHYRERTVIRKGRTAGEDRRDQEGARGAPREDDHQGSLLSNKSEERETCQYFCSGPCRPLS